MFGCQWYEDNLRRLGGLHHIGRRYVKHYLFSGAFIHRYHDHAVVLALMVISAMKTCQLFSTFSQFGWLTIALSRP